MRLILTTALVGALLSGCTATQHLRANDDAATSSTFDAETAINTLRNGNNEVAPGTFEVIDDATYVAPKPLALDRQQVLPSRCDLTYNVRSATILEFGQQITKDCGILVRVTPDAIAASEGAFDATLSGVGASAAAGSAASAASTSGIPMPSGVSLPPPVLGGGSTAFASATGGRGFAANRITLQYTGELTGLLNAVTARMGLSWRYRDGVISVFYLDTKHFKVFQMPSTSSLDALVTSGSTTAAGVAGGAGGAGGGGGSTSGVGGNAASTQTSSVSVKTDGPADLVAAIKSMLTPGGVGRMWLSQSTQTVSVTDTPEVLDRIGAYVEDLNAFATKQVLLNVKVLTVQVNDSDEAGINWNLIYQNLADQYGIGLASSFATSSEAISGSVNILQGNSRFSGSSLIVNALSKQGRVSVVTQPSVTTLNMQAVPVQVGDSDGYIAKTTTTLTGGSGDFAQTSRDTGSITTGFNMNLLPYILPDNRTVLLQFTMQMGALKDLRQVGDENNLVEVPSTSNRNSAQQVRLRSGQTLVLSGFEQTMKRNDRSGVGNAKFWLFGGGAKASTTREVLVVLITPIVSG